MKKILLFYCFTFTATLFSQNQVKEKKLPKAMSADENMIPFAIAPDDGMDFLALPSNMIFPAEWEESEAVAIQWPYPPSASDDGAVLYSKLADAIQQAAKVWIIVDEAADTISLKSMMQQNGVTLYNHKFILRPTNSIWTRDSGPWGFYSGANDTRGLIDLKYYSTRPLDDKIPLYLSEYMGVSNYPSKIKMEGGNFMVDGFGHGFYSTRLLSNNYPWKYSQTKDTVKRLFNLSQITELTKLICDGGTGHIDMYVKLLDEQTLVISKYASVVTASDKDTIEKNYNLLKTLKSVYNRPFKIYRMPMAKRDNASYSITCSDIDNDARGFVNGVFVNKTFIFPCFSNTVSGDVAGDSVATRLYRKLLPGYKVVPIDARYLSTGGGALHCITMQIPAKNPLRFWHPSVEGEQPILNQYPIQSKITNRSGIATAECYWRKKGDGWNKFSLNDSVGYFVGAIPNQSFVSGDTIEYYLSAVSNNGKTMTKPMTAPQGYYRFHVSNTSVGISDVFQKYPDHHFFGVYPNPVKGIAHATVYAATGAMVKAEIKNMLGQTVWNSSVSSLTEGLHELEINTMGITPGIYAYTLFIENNVVGTRKLVIE